LEVTEFNDIVIIVAASRRWTRKDRVWLILDSYMPRTVVEGNCRTGGDLHTRQWCEMRGLHSKSYTADWRRFGDGAGPIRNGRMLRDWMHFPDVRLIAFPMAGGSGTQDCMRQALELGMIVENYGDVRL
jgi:hypothetical protein